MTSVYDVAVAGSSGFLGAAIAAGVEVRGATVARYAPGNPVLREGAIDAGVANARTLVWAASRVNPVLAAERPDLAAAERDDLAEVVRGLVALGDPPRVVFLSFGGTIYDPPDEAPRRATDAATTWLDVSLARDVLGWDARVGLDEGVTRTWASMLAR